MMSNKMTWDWKVIGNDQRLVFKIPLESLKSKISGGKYGKRIPTISIINI
jgi:hypothetical protein